MKRWVLLVACVAFAVGLLLHAPATRLLDWSGVSTSDGVTLYDVRGTLRRGRIGRIQIGSSTLEDVSWSMLPMQLLLLRPAWQVGIELPSGRIDSAIAFRIGGSLVFRTMRGVASVTDIAKLAGQSYVPFDGMVSIDLDRLLINSDRRPERAEGTVRIGNLTWTLVRPPALIGDYHAVLESDSDAIRAVIDDNAATVSAQGTAAYVAEGNWQLDLKLRPTKDAAVPVRNSLAASAKPDSDGWYPIQQTGSF